MATHPLWRQNAVHIQPHPKHQTKRCANHHGVPPKHTWDMEVLAEATHPQIVLHLSTSEQTHHKTATNCSTMATTGHFQRFQQTGQKVHISQGNAPKPDQTLISNMLLPTTTYGTHTHFSTEGSDRPHYPPYIVDEHLDFSASLIPCRNAITERDTSGTLKWKPFSQTKYSKNKKKVSDSGPESKEIIFSDRRPESQEIFSDSEPESKVYTFSCNWQQVWSLAKLTCGIWRTHIGTYA